MLEVLNLVINDMVCFFGENPLVFLLSAAGVVVLDFLAVWLVFLCCGLLDLLDRREEDYADGK